MNTKVKRVPAALGLLLQVADYGRQPEVAKTIRKSTYGDGQVIQMESDRLACKVAAKNTKRLRKRGK